MEAEKLSASSFAVVSCSVLPDVFLRVIEAKRLIASGEVKSSTSACQKVGISRSAYYKYKNSVFTYDEKLTRRIFSLSAVLKDKPGVLSTLLAELHKNGANIMTLNQSVPIDSVATVTVTVKMDGDNMDAYTLITALSKLEGVVETKIISEE